MIVFGESTIQKLPDRNRIIHQVIKNYTAAGIILPVEQKLLMLCLIPLDNLDLIKQLLQSHQWAEIAAS